MAGHLFDTTLDPKRLAFRYLLGLGTRKLNSCTKDPVAQDAMFMPIRFCRIIPRPCVGHPVLGLGF